MELYPNVYRIESLYGGRNLFQYLFVGDNVVLLDTGIAQTPEQTIFPFMDKLKIKPQRLTLAVTTHADLDHQGGNDSIKNLSPQTMLSCGEADRELVEDPGKLFSLRYNFLQEEHRVGLDVLSSPEAGKPLHMNLCFTGGEKIHLADDWYLDVLHVPGHSRGHLALYDSKNRALFSGDAVQGRGCPKATGEMALPVTYYQIDSYLSTIRYFENLPVEALYSGHWPIMHREEIRDFLAESRRTVEFADRAILQNLAKVPAGLTMKELIDGLGSTMGDWPQENWIFAMFPVKGHMDRLEQQGKAKQVPGAKPIKWALA